MTKKIAISVPDDVAERLSAEPNVSAYVTAAVRRAMRVEQTRHALESVGFEISEEGLAHWRAKLADLDSRSTREERAAAWAGVVDRIRQRIEDDER
ncbi:MAG TPA: hypothetical protein VJX66_28085 [Amycolatopsis sp.]|nr:hypothetical protein [Amycolatopsis sp.]